MELAWGRWRRNRNRQGAYLVSEALVFLDQQEQDKPESSWGRTVLRAVIMKMERWMSQESYVVQYCPMEQSSFRQLHRPGYWYLPFRPIGQSPL